MQSWQAALHTAFVLLRATHRVPEAQRTYAHGSVGMEELVLLVGGLHTCVSLSSAQTPWLHPSAIRRQTASALFSNDLAQLMMVVPTVT